MPTQPTPTPADTFMAAVELHRVASMDAVQALHRGVRYAWDDQASVLVVVDKYDSPLGLGVMRVLECVSIPRTPVRFRVPTGGQIRIVTASVLAEYLAGFCGGVVRLVAVSPVATEEIALRCRVGQLVDLTEVANG